MRKVSIALVLGLMISACGGEEAPPKTPTAPEPTPAPTATATETAKTEEPKVQASPADLQKKTMLGIADAMNGHDAKKIDR